MEPAPKARRSAAAPYLRTRLGRTAAALLPRAEHIVFEESSHALQLEEQDKFEDALAAFMTCGSA